jgi:hypothetical protein
LNYSKTFQVIFKAPNKLIKTPENYILNMGGNQLDNKLNTKFLGIELDSNITFKPHIVQICKKLNFILLLMRSIRPYLDIPMMINLYYTFFYPHLIYGIEFWGHAAECEINQILLLQKSALRVILKIHPRGHVTSFFEHLKIMPVQMLFKYRFLILYSKTIANCEICVSSPNVSFTRSKLGVVPQRAKNCRGARSLLTTGVNLLNRYLPGERVCEPLGLRGRLTRALWGCGA